VSQHAVSTSNSTDVVFDERARLQLGGQKMMNINSLATQLAELESQKSELEARKKQLDSKKKELEAQNKKLEAELRKIQSHIEDEKGMPKIEGFEIYSLGNQLYIVSNKSIGILVEGESKKPGNPFRAIHQNDEKKGYLPCLCDSCGYQQLDEEDRYGNVLQHPPENIRVIVAVKPPKTLWGRPTIDASLFEEMKVRAYVEKIKKSFDIVVKC